MASWKLASWLLVQVKLRGAALSLLNVREIDFVDTRRSLRLLNGRSTLKRGERACRIASFLTVSFSFGGRSGSSKAMFFFIG